MPTNTYVALDKVTVGTAAASVSFTGISGAYTDLEVVIEGAMTASSDMRIQFNSDGGSNYSNTTLEGNGTTAQSARWSNQTKLIVNNFATGTGRGLYRLAINNYSNATTYKTVLHRMAFAGNATEAGVGLWRSTSAITSMELFANGTTWISGTTFSLYGIAAEGAAYATGGYVTSDSQYYYHTFTASGTFTPKSTLSCDYLVVAGGGGGASYGGGGGAGGYRTSIGGSQLSVSSAATVTIGSGGAGGTGSGAGSVGNNSVFSTITSAGGGYGGGDGTPIVGGNGGSGGGGAATGAGTPSGGTGNTPSTSPAQGTNGGAGVASGTLQRSGGGGGGASVAGTAAINTTAGNGGAGTANSITGTSVTYAGGGGGGYDGRYGSGTNGTGGAGGGGAGASTGGATTATAGTANTGGGGGGMCGYNSTFGTGGAGGSGIVIVRYAK
jgi:hypothetical protein